MWIFFACSLFLVGEGFVVLPPAPRDILGGEDIRDDWQECYPPEACPVAPCHPNDKGDVYDTPRAAGNPTFGGNFFDSIVETFHVLCSFFKKRAKVQKKNEK
jgi:hypothetical protein